MNALQHLVTGFSIAMMVATATGFALSAPLSAPSTQDASGEATSIEEVRAGSASKTGRMVAPWLP